jgi:hypothetical protein
MIANTLTKPLPNVKAKHFATELGLRVAWGGVLRLQVDWNPSVLYACRIWYTAHDTIVPENHYVSDIRAESPLIVLIVSLSTSDVVTILCDDWGEPYIIYYYFFRYLSNT